MCILCLLYGAGSVRCQDRTKRSPLQMAEKELGYSIAELEATEVTRNDEIRDVRQAFYDVNAILMSEGKATISWPASLTAIGITLSMPKLPPEEGEDEIYEASWHVVDASGISSTHVPTAHEPNVLVRSVRMEDRIEISDRVNSTRSQLTSYYQKVLERERELFRPPPGASMLFDAKTSKIESPSNPDSYVTIGEAMHFHANHIVMVLDEYPLRSYEVRGTMAIEDTAELRRLAGGESIDG